MKCGILFRIGSVWVGAHWSSYNKRLCINLIPFVTFWIVWPGGGGQCAMSKYTAECIARYRAVGFGSKTECAEMVDDPEGAWVHVEDLRYLMQEGKPQTSISKWAECFGYGFICGVSFMIALILILNTH